MRTYLVTFYFELALFIQLCVAQSDAAELQVTRKHFLIIG